MKKKKKVSCESKIFARGKMFKDVITLSGGGAWAALALFVLVGCLFFFTGINWGLPTRLHPDEGVIVQSAIRMVNNKTFEPDVFYRPDHLLIQINSIIYAIVALVTKTPFAELAVSHQHVFYFISRSITALFAAGSVFISFLIGKKRSVRTGLIAAFLFSVFPIYVTHAHYATPDVPTAFFMLLFIYYAMRYMEQPSFARLFYMAIATAGFMCIKYPGAILCILIAVVVVVASIKEKNFVTIVKHGSAAVGMVFALVFAISPVLIFNFDAVRRAFITETGTTHLGADGLGFLGNLLFYFKTYLNASGILLMLFFVVGVYAVVKLKNDLWRWYPLFFSFLYYVFLSYVPLHWERWVVPMFVSPLLMSAIGADYAITAMQKLSKAHRNFKLYRCSLAVVLILITFNLLSGSAANLVNFLVVDTRVVSKDYCTENEITTNNTAYEGYTPLLPQGPKDVGGDFTQTEGKFYLNTNRIRNVVISSDMFERYMVEPERYQKQNELYRALNDDYKLTKAYNVVADRVQSPVEFLNIYRSLAYVADITKTGMSGPVLLFYETTSNNYMKYTLGQPVLFGKENQNFDRYYIKGLSKPEQTGTWSQGKESVFRFYLPEIQDNILLNFKVNPFVGEGVEDQEAWIYGNDVLLDKMVISVAENRSIIIPKDIVADGELEIRFELPKAVSPKELALNADERVLGLFFEEMFLSNP